jgi:hypothetical protein
VTETLSAGFSEAAKMLQQAYDHEEERRQDTVTFSNRSVEDQLIDVFAECSQPSWEGEGSVSVERETLLLAKDLVESLPKTYRTPTISGEPDGHVDLEWYVNPRRVLTVSVSPEGVLYWAALIGAEDPRGSCRFYGEAPKTLVYWIQRVVEG